MAKQTFTTSQVLTAAQMTSLQQTAMGGGSTTAKTTSYTLVAADAGTVVQMNSASATTITVNTALFAAGDTVQIQNIGAGVCTVTAGTATVNTIGSLALSQYAGGELYFNTTSQAFFYGVDAAAASAGGMTLLSTTTLSGTSNAISVTPTGYKDLKVYIYGTNSGTDFDLFVRVNTISTTTYYQSYRGVLGASTAINLTASRNAIYLNAAGSYALKSGNTDNAFNLTISDCNSAQKKIVDHYGGYMASDPGTSQVGYAGVDSVSGTSAAVTTITVLASTSFTAGTCQIYGVK